jgi:hypothetical protein
MSGGWVRDAARSASFPAQWKATEGEARDEARRLSLRFTTAYVTVIQGPVNDPDGTRLVTFRNGAEVALYPDLKEIQ